MPRSTDSFNSGDTAADYQEGCNGTGLVHFGRKNHLNTYRGTKGATLNPEERGDTWTYDKNKGFFAGAIDVRRTFVLETDIASPTEEGALKNGYTCDELRWLEDNGYTFRPDPTNVTRTLAEPPQTPGPTSIRNYDKCWGSESELKVQRDSRFNAIKQNILTQRPTSTLGSNP